MHAGSKINTRSVKLTKTKFLADVARSIPSPGAPRASGLHREREGRGIGRRRATASERREKNGADKKKKKQKQERTAITFISSFSIFFPPPTLFSPYSPGPPTKLKPQNARGTLYPLYNTYRAASVFDRVAANRLTITINILLYYLYKT